jgi:hypothetical protein
VRQRHKSPRKYGQRSGASKKSSTMDSHPPQMTKQQPHGVPRVRKQALTIHRNTSIGVLSKHGRYIFISLTPCEFTTAEPGARGMQNRLTTLSTLSTLYSFAPPPSDLPWNMRNRVGRGHLVRLVRTILHKKSYDGGDATPPAGPAGGH